MMEPWVILSLICAFSLATSDALTKRMLSAGNEYLVAWLRLAFSLPPLIVLLVVLPAPDLDRDFFLSFFGALPLEIAAVMLYIKALRISPLSLTLPFLSLTPLFLILFSWLVAGDRVSLAGAVGIGTVTLGGYVLNLGSLRSGILAPLRAIAQERGSIYMIVVALIYSVTSSLGKRAVMHSSPAFFAATYYTTLTACFLPVVIVTQGGFRQFREALRLHVRDAALPSLFHAIMVITHFYAVSMANVAYMVSIKRSSLLIGSLYGFLYFGEKDVKERLAGALLMFGGFLVIVLSG
jgi:drug/metabolite transporter (DMT)-like permease